MKYKDICNQLETEHNVWSIGMSNKRIQTNYRLDPNEYDADLFIHVVDKSLFGKLNAIGVHCDPDGLIGIDDAIEKALKDMFPCVYLYGDLDQVSGSMADRGLTEAPNV